MLYLIGSCVQVQANNDAFPPPPEEDESDQIILPAPKISITVESSDILQVTVSKTCLDVLSKLGKVKTSPELQTIEFQSHPW